MKKINTPIHSLAVMRLRLLSPFLLPLPLRLPLLSLLLLPLLGSCIHEYPDEAGKGAGTGTETGSVSVSVEVTLDRELIPLPAAVKSASGILPEGYVPRFIVEARKWGETSPCARQVVTVDASELLKGTDEAIALPVTLSLDAAAHNFTVWADYVQDESLCNAHYNADNLRSVSHLPPYADDHTRRDAFFGNLSVDLSGSGGSSAATVRVAMKRPLAHYRIVATDVQEFLNKQHANGRPGAGAYEVHVTYQYFLVTRFNATTGEAVDSGTGYGYTRRLTLTADADECEPGADYVLAGEGESGVMVALEVTDSQGNTTSRVTNLEIPYKRGCTTTVRGAFLTANAGGGGEGGLDLGIDSDYEGEFNIDISR